MHIVLCLLWRKVSLRLSRTHIDDRSGQDSLLHPLLGWTDTCIASTGLVIGLKRVILDDSQLLMSLHSWCFPLNILVTTGIFDRATRCCCRWCVIDTSFVHNSLRWYSLQSRTTVFATQRHVQSICWWCKTLRFVALITSTRWSSCCICFIHGSSYFVVREVMVLSRAATPLHGASKHSCVWWCCSNHILGQFVVVKVNSAELCSALDTALPDCETCLLVYVIRPRWIDCFRQVIRMLYHGKFLSPSTGRLAPRPDRHSLKVLHHGIATRRMTRPALPSRYIFHLCRIVQIVPIQWWLLILRHFPSHIVKWVYSNTHLNRLLMLRLW